MFYLFLSGFARCSSSSSCTILLQSFVIILCDLKFSRFQAKINENFANYFLNTKANNKCFILLKCTCKGLQHKWVRAVKSKPKALRHFKVDPILKIDETIYKQAESIPQKIYEFLNIYLNNAFSLSPPVYCPRVH